jgi:hypothetical protein
MTIDELIILTERDFIPNHSFYDEFPEYKGIYRFNGKEEEVIGEWIELAGEKNQSLFSYVFYPNNLFIANSYIMTQNEKTYLSHSIGIWSIEKNILMATIFTFQYVETKGESFDYSYEACQPYKVELINTNDIDAIGYSRKVFKELLFPESVNKKLNLANKSYGPVHRFRQFYIKDILSAEKEKDYGYFKLLPVIVNKRLSGIEMVSDQTTIRDFLENHRP